MTQRPHLPALNYSGYSATRKTEYLYEEEAAARTDLDPGKLAPPCPAWEVDACKGRDFPTELLPSRAVQPPRQEGQGWGPGLHHMLSSLSRSPSTNTITCCSGRQALWCQIDLHHYCYGGSPRSHPKPGRRRGYNCDPDQKNVVHRGVGDPCNS